jgi:hypothetical protein
LRIFYRFFALFSGIKIAGCRGALFFAGAIKDRGIIPCRIMRSTPVLLK